MQANELIFFSLFLVFVLSVLVFDLGVFSKENKTIGFKEALIWTAVWFSFGMGFFLLLRFKGHLLHDIQNIQQLKLVIEEYAHPISVDGLSFEQALALYRNNLSIEYLTGYFIEYALSVDNIFVIMLILSSFGVRERYYKRVLFWGILGALVMRFIFIFLGAAMIHRFEWILYLFGAFLCYSGIKIFFKKGEEEQIDETRHPVVRLASKVFRVFPRFIGENFFVRKDRKLWVTPLFLALLVIEFSDLIFAVDSVPAVFGVTKDPFIVFFSNIFAILGLRSLFFLLSNIMHMFYLLKYGLGVLLTFIGVKLMFHHQLAEWGMSNELSLYIVLSILAGSVILSRLFPPKAVV